jgi:hypothetical protein
MRLFRLKYCILLQKIHPIFWQRAILYSCSRKCWCGSVMSPNADEMRMYENVIRTGIIFKSEQIFINIIVLIVDNKVENSSHLLNNVCFPLTKCCNFSAKNLET